MRMDDERLPKRIFDGDVATSVRRQGGPKRHYKDPSKNYPDQLQINPASKEYLAQDRSASRRAVRTSAAINVVNWIATANPTGRLEDQKRSRSTPPVSKPSQHGHATNAHSSLDSAASDIFGRNATTHLRKH
ncbi:unnamed protein product [Schistocephalus solidus]|uniref:Uncharacterized protein n=1 Tax=Schistocephalus solidus TaxID=70667 RepID=A0A183SH00_SCHSO|nr:unnamed protein product [Schistocephalus solidus]